MNLLTDLENNIVVLTRTFSDGSEVKYKTTKRKDILSSLNLLDDEMLYDLDTRKEIPLDVLENISHYEVTSSIKYKSELDALAEKGAKIVW